MSYPKVDGHADAKATFRGIAEVPTIAIRDTLARLVAPGWVTQGEFGLFRWEMGPRSGGPAPHLHRTFSESFYVLDGRVRLFDGQAWVDATVGDFVFVPRGGVHAFSNDSDEAATMLILFAPGAPRERYFEELAEIARSGRQLSSEEWTALYARHDQSLV